MPKKTFPQESEFNRIHLESDKHVVVTHTATVYCLKYMSQVNYIVHNLLPQFGVTRN